MATLKSDVHLIGLDGATHSYATGTDSADLDDHAYEIFSGNSELFDGELKPRTKVAAEKPAPAKSTRRKPAAEKAPESDSE